MWGLLKLLEEGRIENLSPDDIRDLQKSGASTILQLSARLSVLSSKLVITRE
jgi:hypothetical protein